MSYIDCFNHEVIGEVLRLPLYKANEDINGDEFICKKDQLILGGGGGGEHPGVVINNINDAMKMYLSFEKDIEEFDYTLYNKVGLTFFDWSIPIYYRFYKLALTLGYDEDNSGYFDMWLLSLIVKEVINKQPELIDEKLLSYLS